MFAVAIGLLTVLSLTPSPKSTPSWKIAKFNAALDAAADAALAPAIIEPEENVPYDGQSGSQQRGQQLQQRRDGRAPGAGSRMLSSDRPTSPLRTLPRESTWKSPREPESFGERLDATADAALAPALVDEPEVADAEQRVWQERRGALASRVEQVADRFVSKYDKLGVGRSSSDKYQVRWLRPRERAGSSGRAPIEGGRDQRVSGAQTPLPSRKPESFGERLDATADAALAPALVDEPEVADAEQRDWQERRTGLASRIEQAAERFIQKYETLRGGER